MPIDLEIENDDFDMDGKIGYEVHETDYDKLKNKPVHMDTVDHWNAQKDFIGEAGHIYVYTDYTEKDGEKIAGIKISDGKAYLIDTPFVSGNTDELYRHINDQSIHVTDEEKDFWNNKVTCFLSQGDEETLVFTKENKNG